MSTADHIRAAADAVDEAMDHHQNACDAHDRGDARKVALEHSHVTRCLRTARRAFRAMAAEQEVNGGTKNVQTSNGVDESGGSANGRAGRSPLMTGDVKGWLDRARAGSRR